MKLKQIKSAGILSEEARQRLEDIFFLDLDNATGAVQKHFPNHIVDKKGNCLQVLTKDRSIVVTSFRDAKAQSSDFVETHFGLRSLGR